MRGAVMHGPGTVRVEEREAPRIVEPRWELCGRDAYVFGPLAFPSRQ